MSLFCFNTRIRNRLEKPSFVDLNGIKDITVRAGKDFEVHIPYKGNPKPTAQLLIGDQELTSDDRFSVKVKNLFRTNRKKTICFFSSGSRQCHHHFKSKSGTW